MLRSLAALLIIDSLSAWCATPAAAFDCSRSFCGCWTPATLNFETIVLDKDQIPLKGIQLFCSSEREPIGTSGKDGKITFTVETMQSPGCHYQRCTNIKIVDPAGSFEDLETTVYVVNRKLVVMKKRAAD